MSHSTWKMDRPQRGEIVMPPRRDESQCPLELLTTIAKHNCTTSYATPWSDIPWNVPQVN